MNTFACLTVAAALAAPALAQHPWFDDFESYPNDVPIEGQGGWTHWDGGTTTHSYVVDTISHLGSQALEVRRGADTVRDLEDATREDGRYACGSTFRAPR